VLLALLADAAPNGAGLAILAVIFLVFVAVALGVVALIVRAVLKRRRHEGPPPTPTTPPAEQELKREGLTD